MNEPRTIYAVEGGNYSDYRIDSLWSTRDAAERRLGLLRSDRWNSDLYVEERTLDDPEVASERTAWVAYGVYCWTSHENAAAVKTDEITSRYGEPGEEITADPYGVKVIAPVAAPFPRLQVWVTAETRDRAAKVLGEQLPQEIVKLEQGYYGDMWAFVTEYAPSTYTSGGTTVITFGGNQ